MSFVVGWVCRGTLKLPFWALRTAQATARGLVLAQGLIDARGVAGLGLGVRLVSLPLSPHLTVCLPVPTHLLHFHSCLVVVGSSRAPG